MTLSSRPQAETAAAERRLVSLLFADVVDSTSLAERMDPEDWSGAIRAVLDLMSVPIERYGGTVAQRMGDGLLAVFGAPAAHEDDAVRAVQAALEMVAAVEEAAPQLRRDFGKELRDGPQIRVGINTGLAIVEGMGDRSRDVDALGDTVNVAARMQSAARPGTVLVTGETWRYAGPTFQGTSLGGVQVKGKAEPVDAWEVLGRQDQPGSGRGLAGLTSPMVGRDDELDRLTTLLSAIRAGRGRAAVLIGEPGVGKSRLLAELHQAALAGGASAAAEAQRAAAGSESVAGGESAAEATGAGAGTTRWIEARCISYGENVPYGLVADLVAATLGLPPPSMPEPRLASLETRIRQTLGEAWHEHYVALAHLLSLPLAPEMAAELAPLSPQALIVRYLSAVEAVMRRLCALGPTVVVIEDAHWADASSVEIVGQLLPLGHELPVLILLTSRPERNAVGWRLVQTARETFGDALTELPLTPLDAAHSSVLIGNLLEIESLPQRLRNSIMERSEGNPFFVEELIRMLIDRGWVVRKGDHWVGSGTVAEAEVPDTLRGLLLARIDRLPDEARRTLRMASVIGRDVPVRLLEQITDDPSGTSRALGLAEASGLVRFASADPEPVYRFRHVLIQEAAYDSLLKSDRRRLHRRVGEVLEQEAGTERREELAPILGLHFERAGDAERAVDYLHMAGRQALRRRAVADAQELLARAAAALDDAAESPENDRRWVEIAIDRASANALGVEFKEDLERLAEAEVRATRLGDERLLGLVLARQAGTGAFETGLFRIGNDIQASRIARALEIGKRLGDPEILAFPSALKGIELTRTGQRREAVPLLEDAIDGLEQYVVNEASFYAGQLALTLGELGDTAAAEAELARARTLAERSGDPKALADIEIFTGFVLAMQGRHAEALEYGKRGFQLALESKEVLCQAMGAYLSGQSEMELSHPVPAIEWLDRATSLAASSSAPGVARMCSVTLKAARALAGQGQEALAGLDLLIDQTRAAGDPVDEALSLIRRAQIMISLATPDVAAARTDVETAVSLLDRAETLPYAEMARQFLAQLDGPPASRA
jgi:class 3 adenylate cyclase/tetratricopeptide (TPR) repeat protein